MGITNCKEVVLDELESVDAALEEITRRFVETDADRGRLENRMMELRQNRDEVRRRRARNTLDAYLPPLTIYSFERDARPTPPAPIRRSLAILFESLLDVWVIWWRKQVAARFRA